MPFENEWINSKSFVLFDDKHKYSVRMGGQHSFTLREPVQDYLAENPVKFTVKINDKV